MRLINKIRRYRLFLNILGRDKLLFLPLLSIELVGKLAGWTIW